MCLTADEWMAVSIFSLVGSVVLMKYHKLRTARLEGQESRSPGQHAMSGRCARVVNKLSCELQTWGVC